MIVKCEVDNNFKKCKFKKVSQPNEDFMKRIISASLLTLSGILMSNLAFAQCNTQNDTILFLGSLRYNNLKKTEELLKNNCIVWNDKTKKMTFKQIKTTEQLQLIEKYNRGLHLEGYKLELSQDLFSSTLMSEIFPKSAQVEAKEEQETETMLNNAGNKGQLNYSWRQTGEDKTKLLNYLGQKNLENVSFNKDVIGNSVLVYIILANRPELIRYSYTGLGDKKIWTKENNSGFYPIHFIFSPLLRTKNVSELNDKILKEVPVSYLLNAPQLKLGTGKSYDFFQFAELMKENNPDFYKKLKEKYKFEVTSTNSSSDIKKLINNELVLKGLKNTDD